MTLVNTTTGELVESITEADVRESIERVYGAVESIWDEWAWQVENRTWEVLGYADWDDMRIAEYGALTSITAPRAERPELIARFRQAGLTQRETADTLGVNVRTVIRDDEPSYTPRAPKVTNVTFADEDVVEAEIVDDEPAPPAPRREWEAEPSKEITLINDIRLYLRALASAPEVRKLTPVGKQHIIDALQNTITQIEGN